jgi:large subunit ribosomal protein L19
MSKIIQNIVSQQLKNEVPDFRPGDTLRVHQLIKEGDKERVQIFEGVAIRVAGNGTSRAVTVRKISYGIGVERIYPVHSPRVVKIEIKQKGRVRRSRLYYLRELQGKAARIQELRSVVPGAAEEPATPAVQTPSS